MNRTDLKIETQSHHEPYVLREASILEKERLERH